MANVLDVPYGQLGDMRLKCPTSIAVETLAPPQGKRKANPGAAKSRDRNVGAEGGAPNATTYSQAKRFATVRNTTGADGRRNNAPRVPVRDDIMRDGPVVVNDEIFAHWDTKALPRGSTLKTALAEVVATNTRDPKEPIMRIKVKFSDASEVNFQRSNVRNPATLAFSNYFNPHDVEDESMGLVAGGGGGRVDGLGADGCLVKSSRATDPRTRRLPQCPNMKDLEMPTSVQLKEMFKAMDYNGNGLLSLAEVDQATRVTWPHFNNKAVLIRAFTAADANESGWIGRLEFEFLIRFIINYTKANRLFSKVDTSGDNRIDFKEFASGAREVQLQAAGNPQQLRADFDAIDRNHGGMILFEEFCHYVASQQADLQLTLTNGDKASILAKHKQNRSVVNSRSTNKKVETLAPPNMAKANEYFDRADMNGNAMLSLAELDKVVIELWPRFNLKPAIMRAYKAADKNNTGLISRSEFKLFLDYITTFSNLWAAFKELDGNSDRRVSRQEFCTSAAVLGICSESEALPAFMQIDSNGGGYVLFEEFCKWMTEVKLGSRL